MENHIIVNPTIVLLNVLNYCFDPTGTFFGKSALFTSTDLAKDISKTETPSQELILDIEHSMNDLVEQGAVSKVREFGVYCITYPQQGE